MAELDKVSCPKCGEKMEQGYIYVSRGDLAWTMDGISRIFPSFTDFNEAEVLLGETIFKVKKHHAFRCRQCGVVTFEYDKEQEK